jgi:hypothetical protein
VLAERGLPLVGETLADGMGRGLDLPFGEERDADWSPFCMTKLLQRDDDATGAVVLATNTTAINSSC